MNNDFLVVCVRCLKEYDDWDHSCQTNIHFSPNKPIILTCFNCGMESEIKPRQLEKPTKEQYKLLKEKEKIERQIN